MIFEKIGLTILALFLPPLAVLLVTDGALCFVLNCLLTLLGWIPGFIHACFEIWATDNYEHNRRRRKQHKKHRRSFAPQRRGENHDDRFPSTWFDKHPSYHNSSHYHRQLIAPLDHLHRYHHAQKHVAFVQPNADQGLDVAANVGGESIRLATPSAAPHLSIEATPDKRVALISAASSEPVHIADTVEIVHPTKGPITKVEAGPEQGVILTATAASQTEEQPTTVLVESEKAEIVPLSSGEPSIVKSTSAAPSNTAVVELPRA